MYYNYEQVKEEFDNNVFDQVEISDNLLYLIQRKIEKETFKEEINPEYIKALKDVLNSFKAIKEHKENEKE